MAYSYMETNRLIAKAKIEVLRLKLGLYNNQYSNLMAKIHTAQHWLKMNKLGLAYWKAKEIYCTAHLLVERNKLEDEIPISKSREEDKW